jgi:CheY-like chemotaxis protein
MAKDKSHPSENAWNVIIADDEGMVHMVTEMALKNIEFDGKPLKIHSAYTAKQTLDIIRELPDRVAVILLDIVMETLDAGLQAVPLIRDELTDHEVRIVVRTGQAGRNAQDDIIRNYDINDFYDKATLDHDKLINAVILALRNYRDILRNRQ